jgi:hypothetical protein
MLVVKQGIAFGPKSTILFGYLQIVPVTLVLCSQAFVELPSTIIIWNLNACLFAIVLNPRALREIHVEAYITLVAFHCTMLRAFNMCGRHTILTHTLILGTMLGLCYGVTPVTRFAFCLVGDVAMGNAQWLAMGTVAFYARSFAIHALVKGAILNCALLATTPCLLRDCEFLFAVLGAG